MGEEDKEIKINIYRHQYITGVCAWCYAMWVGGRYDSGGTLDCGEDATDEEAIKCAHTMPLLVTGPRIVARVDDC